MKLKGLFTPSPNKTASYAGYFINDPNPRGGVYNDNVIPFTYTYPRQYLQHLCQWGRANDKKKIQIKHNGVKNPKWPKANQLAIYKRGRGFELGTYA